MNASKAYEILSGYKKELGLTLTPDERDALDYALALLLKQISAEYQGAERIGRAKACAGCSSTPCNDG